MQHPTRRDAGLLGPTRRTTQSLDHHVRTSQLASDDSRHLESVVTKGVDADEVAAGCPRPQVVVAVVFTDDRQRGEDEIRPSEEVSMLAVHVDVAQRRWQPGVQLPGKTQQGLRRRLRALRCQFKRGSHQWQPWRARKGGQPSTKPTHCRELSEEDHVDRRDPEPKITATDDLIEE